MTYDSIWNYEREDNKMKYRFTLKAVVANLTFGKVMYCYRDIYSSEELQ